MNSRNQILDLFKGIAIIAVILYHANLFTYGYLGVEIFLVIGGFLITKSILRSYEKGNFSYWSYICNRLVRLWPLALIISAIALLGGYFTMLPDAYKNTCETAVGTATFTNNFVQYITSGDYWDTANEYKPLMHTWYLGVIFQFYVLYPFIFMLCHRFSNDFVKSTKVV
ncbi:MAG: acyltransferase, partial [Prevotella sp.]|nr:acyltransferase [Prevotella sp.]